MLIKPWESVHFLPTDTNTVGKWNLCFFCSMLCLWNKGLPLLWSELISVELSQLCTPLHPLSPYIYKLNVFSFAFSLSQNAHY